MDPVTGFLFLTFGLGMCLIGVLVGRSWRDEFEPPPPLRPPYPLTHVRPRPRRRPERIGDCAECGKKGVPVQLYSDSPIVDPVDTCNGCIRALIDAPIGGLA